MKVYYYAKKKPSRSPVVFTLIGIVVGIITLAVLLPEQTSNSPIISPIARAVFQQTLPRTHTPSVLPSKIEQALEGTTGTYAVYVKHLTTDEVYLRHEHQVFEPASLYKLWVMAAAYAEIEQGDLTEDDILSDSIAALNQSFGIAPEHAELTEGGITISVKNAIHQMITISHNYAALVLSKNLRLTTVSEYLKQNGLTHSTLGDPPSTTASDIGLFFEKLYRGKLANTEHTQAMIETLKKQTFIHKIPRYLPESVEIAHKTGELFSFTHDAGIVYTPKGDYIIVIMSESEAPHGAEDRIADISKVVYEYFEGK